MYKIEDIKKETLKYFNGDELSADVWIKKYSLKDSEDNYYELSPKDMHNRLAKEFARIEKRYPNPLSEKKIFGLLDKFKYIVPQGSPMSGIGNDHQTVSISNCFVIGNEYDSYGGIMQTDQEQIQLMKRRGGVGHDLSHIRPKGTAVKNSALTSTGVVPFMERFSNSTREVAQDGRRGALMLSISIKHPDAEDFIDAKLESGKVTGANISIKLDDGFMEAVKNNSTYIQQFPIDSDSPLITKEVNAKKLWNKITTNAWKSAEPGILFWDTILRESPAGVYGEDWKEKSTNPCGEIPLNPYDSCRLLAINLFSYVAQPFTKEAKFDIALFQKHVGYAQKLSDDIVDLELEKILKIIDKINEDPEDSIVKQTERELWFKIMKKAQEGRRTGTGITGEGDMLAALGLTYGSDESIKFSETVHKTMAIAAYKSSVRMAKDRGAFPIFDADLDYKSDFIKRICDEDAELFQDMLGIAPKGRRNIAMLTIAPTGTTSMMTQTTSGIEPVFLPVYKRRRKINPQEKDVKVDFTDEMGDSWTEYNVFHHKFVEWFIKWNELGLTYNEGLNTLEGKTEQDLRIILENSPYNGATSNDVNWLQKVKLQGAVQKWVDHSISVTVNVPKDVKHELISEIYSTAHEVGCKGITVYRDGSRSGVLLAKTEDQEVKVKDRPKSLPCDIHYVQANKKKYYVIVGLLDDKPYEIFAFGKKHIQIPQIRKDGILVKVKSGMYNLTYNGTTIDNITQHFQSPEEDGFTRLMSLLLRRGIPTEDIVDQVNKSESFIGGFYKAITRVLSKNYMEDLELEERCPQCDSKLMMVEGCKICTCGEYSKCG